MVLPINNSSKASREASKSIRGVGGFAFCSCAYGAILLVGLMDWILLDGPITLGVCIFLIFFIDLSYLGIKSSVVGFDENAKKSSLWLTVIYLIFDFRDKEKSKQLGQAIVWTIVFGFLCIAYITKLFAGKLAITKSSLVILSALPIYLAIRYVVIYLWKKSNKTRNKIDDSDEPPIR